MKIKETFPRTEKNATKLHLLAVSRDAVGREGALVLERADRDLATDRELQVVGSHLDRVGATKLVVRDFFRLDDLDGLGLGAVATGHLAVHGADSVSKLEGAELLVPIF